MLRRFVLPLLIAAVTLASPLASPLAAQKPTTPADVRRVLGALAHDSMEGRGSATVGGARAARFIAAEMKKAGLEPLGDSGYFQRVPVTRDSVTVQPRGTTRRNADGTVTTTPPDPAAPIRKMERLRVRESLAALDTVPLERKPAAVNVVGVIRGSDPTLKDEYILVDAHYDHLGMRGPGVNGDSIFNGADDDASGVTAVLEIARQINAGAKPKRTIVFAATMGEEVGLLGTNWYIAHPPIPLTQMAANLEIEMIARPDSLAGGVGKAWLTGYERSNMGETLAAKGVPIVPDKRPSENFFQRSDNIAFAMKGIVAHTLSSFNLHKDYHQLTDDISRVDFDHMAGVINAAVAATRILSDGTKPEWKAGGKPEPRTRP